MAKVDSEIKVSIEKAIHDGLCDTLKLIYSKHGVRVDSVLVTWVDASTSSESKMLINEIEIKSTTKHL